MNCQMTKLEHDRQTNHHRAVEGGGKVRGMKEILAAIDEGGERGLDLSDTVFINGKIQIVFNLMI